MSREHVSDITEFGKIHYHNLKKCLKNDPNSLLRPVLGSS